VVVQHHEIAEDDPKEGSISPMPERGCILRGAIGEGTLCPADLRARDNGREWRP